MKRLIPIMCVLAIVLMVSPTLAVLSPTPGGPGGPKATKVYPYVEGENIRERITEDGVLEQFLGFPVEYPRVEVIKAYSIRPGPGKEHDRLSFAEIGKTYRVWTVEGKWLKVGPRKLEKDQWIHSDGVKEIARGSHNEGQWVPVRKPEPPPNLLDKAIANWPWLAAAVVFLLIFVVLPIRATRKRRRDKEARDHRHEGISLGNRHEK